MAKQQINVGTSPNSRTGDTLRTAFSKINENFTEVYDNLTLLNGTTNPDAFIDLNIRGTVSDLAGNILLDGTTGKLTPSALPTNVPIAYQFAVSFDSLGNVLAVSGLPTGWSGSVLDNVVSVTHPLNKPPVQITYWGYQNNGDLRLRMPTPGYQAIVKPQQAYQLDLYLNTAVTGADNNQYALINLVF